MKSAFSRSGTLLVLVFLTSSGCQSRPTTPTVETWQTLEHEIGEITAGVEIIHEFTLTNDLPTVLEIKKDEDIAAKCGCSSITPAERRLAPGAATKVIFRVDTRNRAVPFRFAARIVWTDTANQPHPAEFFLVGVARPPLVLQPDELVFERQEVTDECRKELKVIVASGVDEGSVTVEPLAGDLAVEMIRSEKGYRVYSVKCLQQPRSESEEFHEIFLSAKLTPELGSIPVSAKLLVHVPEVVALEVQPKTLDLRLGPEGRTVGKLMLSGEAMKDGADVESLSCAEYKLEWKVTRARRGSPATVEITFLAAADKRGPEKTTLYVKVKGLPALHVPVSMRQ